LTDERYRGNRVAVAERDGELVGVAMSGPPLDDTAPWARQLYVLYVYAADHGTGAGPALLEAVVYPDESVALWVADPNPRAQAFYRKHGFVADGTVQVRGRGAGDPHGPRRVATHRGPEKLSVGLCHGDDVVVTFDAELWIWESRRADTWVFVSVPARDLRGDSRPGCGPAAEGLRFPARPGHHRPQPVGYIDLSGHPTQTATGWASRPLSAEPRA
jgi:hypothetical protein